MSHLIPPVDASDHVSGPRSAPIVLVEFGDFQCPYCGAAYPELKAVKQAMGDKLCFVFRNFPLVELHAHALQAADFAEAAASEGKFSQMHDMLFEHQNALDEASLVRYAERIGLTDAAVEGARQASSARKWKETSKAAIAAACREHRGSSSTGSAGKARRKRPSWWRRSAKPA